MFMTPHPFKYHFFVSYTTREDEVRAIVPLVDAFVKELEQRGFTAKPPFWLDRIEIGQVTNMPDKTLRKILADGIDQCIALIAFVSPGYVNSEFCRFEWSHFGNSSPIDRSFAAPLIWKRPKVFNVFDDGDGETFEPDAWSVWEMFERHGKRIDFNVLSEDWQRVIAKTAEFLNECYNSRGSRWNHLQEFLRVVRWRSD
jgi:TIR domain